MHQINTRGTFLCSKLCLPHLARSSNGHILMIPPPLNMEERWFAPHVAYSIAKFGMSLCVLGLSGDLLLVERDEKRVRFTSASGPDLVEGVGRLLLQPEALTDLAPAR